MSIFIIPSWSKALHKKQGIVLLITASVWMLAACSSRVVLGDERFDMYLPLLEGKRVAIYSNPSGIVGDKVDGWCLGGGEEVTEASAGVPFGQPALEDRGFSFTPAVSPARNTRATRTRCASAST